MFLTLLLVIAIMLLCIVATISLIVGGIGVLAVFGDVIVFVIIIVAIIKLIRRGHKKG